VPAWGDYSLSQLSADSFRIRKRTKAGHGWIDAAWGRRAPGLGYVGGTSGGVAFGLRDFWQRHPTQLDIRNAHTDAAQVTLWMWSPDAPAMDLRFYHDGMGMDTHAEELQGLDITYEDYEKGFGTPVGVARSSEITLWALDATPPRERLVQMAASGADAAAAGGRARPYPGHARVRQPVVAARPLHAGARRHRGPARRPLRFLPQGGRAAPLVRLLGLRRHPPHLRRRPPRMALRRRRLRLGQFGTLARPVAVVFFLRTGRADIFRMGEAMVRHTSEVDTYHLGRFAGLGSRHNVQHWGCSAKQVRISTAVYRRMYYYLTADERIGDIMRERSTPTSGWMRSTRCASWPTSRPKGRIRYAASFGTDWASLVANWLTEWERSGSTRWRDKIFTGMRDIAAMPHGFFNGDRMGYEPDTGRLHNMIGNGVRRSHLNAVFGAVEIFDELIALTGDRGFERAWLEYCELFNAPDEEQRRRLGKPHGATHALYSGHSRLTAYAAWKRKDPAGAARVAGVYGRRSGPAVRAGAWPGRTCSIR
jgi:hypothetical protein